MVFTPAQFSDYRRIKIRFSPDIFYEWNAITNDPDDNKYFDTAVSGGADYLVTNDKHFDEAKKLHFPSVQIVSGEDFLKIVQNLQ